jgi:hypothetical protein
MWEKATYGYCVCRTPFYLSGVHADIPNARQFPLASFAEARSKDWGRHVAEDREEKYRPTRRKVIQRGAVIGAVVWTVPVVSSIRLPASAQVGSPAPPPEPPPPEPSSTPTQTTTSVPGQSPSSTTEVGGVKFVGGSDLPETGRSVAGHTIAGAGLTILGAGLRKIAGKPPSDEPSPVDESPPQS